MTAHAAGRSGAWAYSPWRTRMARAPHACGHGHVLVGSVADDDQAVGRDAQQVGGPQQAGGMRLARRPAAEVSVRTTHRTRRRSPAPASLAVWIRDRRRSGRRRAVGPGAPASAVFGARVAREARRGGSGEHADQGGHERGHLVGTDSQGGQRPVDGPALVGALRPAGAAKASATRPAVEAEPAGGSGDGVTAPAR